jgi:hypothetical protein
MGAYLKYLIPLLVVALGALAFQNCGQRLQANGDPYENRNGIIQVDDPGVDSPGADNNNAGGVFEGIPGFTTESICAKGADKSLIYEARLGQKNGDDAVYIQIADGRYKIYPWPAGQSVLTVNDQITSTLKILNISLDSQNRLTVTVSAGGASGSEVLFCQ